MAQVADPASYQEVIGKLSAYSNKVFEQCANMMAAASACEQNMGDDPAAAKSTEKLMKCIEQIRSGMTQIHSIQAAMRKELEDIQIAAAPANY